MGKAQVTIYIAMGILITIVFTFVYFLGNMLINEPEFQQFELSTERFVQQCIESSIAEGAYLVALQGGFYPMPSNYNERTFPSGASNVTLGMNTTHILLPNQLKLELNVANATRDKLKVCLNMSTINESLAIQDVGINITKIEINLTENRTLGYIEYLENRSGIVVNKTYLTALDIRLLRMSNITSNLLLQFSSNPVFILNTLLGLERIYNIKLEVAPINTYNTVAVSVTDPQTSYLEQNFSFISEVQYGP